MPEIQFKLPAGVYRNGTERESAGRWYDANLVRWYDGQVRPVGGWVAHSASTFTGKARATLTWKDNSANSWIGIGTESHLYAMDRLGNLSDITPAGYTSGRADATYATGYGAGAYGVGTFGTPRNDTTATYDATVWSLDTWGEDLVGCNADDGFIYQWNLNTAVVAAKVTNAPKARALVVTSERFLMALGTTDPRTVAWSDQQNDTVWTPSATNQAGSFPLQTAGRLMCGKRLTGVTALWTDTDMWIATYLGGTLVYGFTKAGSGCGIVSQGAVAVTATQAVWMGRQGFWVYDGYARPMECDVSDYVFSNINTTQASKVSAVLNAAFSEVWWFYPSAGSIENDSYVIWNYLENTWSIGKLGRYSGVDAGGAFVFPIWCGTDQTVYEHESGFSYGGDTPYAETGPLEFAPVAVQYAATGAKVWQANQFVPDELLAGDVTATFKTKIYPNGTESTFGPYTLSDRTDVRFTGRQVKLRVTGAAADSWRFGNAKLLIQGQGGR